MYMSPVTIFHNLNMSVAPTKSRNSHGLLHSYSLLKPDTGVYLKTKDQWLCVVPAPFSLASDVKNPLQHTLTIPGYHTLKNYSMNWRVNMVSNFYFSLMFPNWLVILNTFSMCWSHLKKYLFISFTLFSLLELWCFSYWLCYRLSINYINLQTRFWPKRIWANTPLDFSSGMRKWMELPDFCLWVECWVSPSVLSVSFSTSALFLEHPLHVREWSTQPWGDV